MRTIAVELAPHGITVNNVAPGAVMTSINENLKEHPEQMEELLSEIPLNRMGQTGGDSGPDPLPRLRRLGLRHRQHLRHRRRHDAPRRKPVGCDGGIATPVRRQPVHDHALELRARHRRVCPARRGYHRGLRVQARRRPVRGTTLARRRSGPGNKLGPARRPHAIPEPHPTSPRRPGRADGPFQGRRRACRRFRARRTFRVQHGPVTGRERPGRGRDGRKRVPGAGGLRRGARGEDSSGAAQPGADERRVGHMDAGSGDAGGRGGGPGELRRLRRYLEHLAERET